MGSYVVAAFLKDIEIFKTYPTYTVVLFVIGRLLNGISPYDSGISMIFVRGIGNEVNFSKELLLMVLKFSHHLVGLRYKEGLQESIFFDSLNERRGKTFRGLGEIDVP